MVGTREGVGGGRIGDDGRDNTTRPERLADLARQVNPVVRGWMQYYGTSYRSALYPLLQRINAYLVRFLRRKYRRLRPLRRAMACWRRITSQSPRLFAHWEWVATFWR